MRLIKFEKEMCGKCVAVEGFLEDQGVIGYKKIDVENYSDIDFIAKYVEMTLPVVVLLDDNGELIQRSAGFEPSELMEIVEKLSK